MRVEKFLDEIMFQAEKTNTIHFPTNIKICTYVCARKADTCFEMNKVIDHCIPCLIIQI